MLRKSSLFQRARSAWKCNHLRGVRAKLNQRFNTSQLAARTRERSELLQYLGACPEKPLYKFLTIFRRYYQLRNGSALVHASHLPANARATIAVILNKVTYLHYNLFDHMPRIRRWQADF